MSENRKYITTSENSSQSYRAKNRRVITSREKFNGYNTDKWEHTHFNDKTGGFVVTEKERIKEGNKSAKNLAVFNNERNTCVRFASYGFQMEHLSEPSRSKAPDSRIVRGNHSIVLVNGKKAEIKRLKSSNNIINYAKDAIRGKKADLIIYEFTEHAPGIESKISELVRKYHIHGYYYYSDTKGYKEF